MKGCGGWPVWCWSDRADEMVRSIAMDMGFEEIVHGFCGTMFANYLEVCAKNGSWKCAMALIRMGVDCLVTTSDDRCVATIIAERAPAHVCEQMVIQAFSHASGKGCLVLAICATRRVYFSIQTRNCVDDKSVEFAIAADSWSLLSRRTKPRDAQRVRVLCRCAHATSCLDAMADYKHIEYSPQQHATTPLRSVVPSLMASIREDRIDELQKFPFADAVMSDACHVPLRHQTENSFDSFFSLCLVLRAKNCIGYLFWKFQVCGMIPMLRYTDAFIRAWMCADEKEAIELVPALSEQARRACTMRGESAMSVFLERGWLRAFAAIAHDSASPNGIVCRGAPWIQASLYSIAGASAPLLRTALRQLRRARPGAVFYAEFQFAAERLMYEGSFERLALLVRSASSALHESTRASFLTRVERMLSKRVCDQMVDIVCDMNIEMHLGTMEIICVSPAVSDAHTAKAARLFLGAPRSDHEREKVIEWCASAAKPETCMQLHLAVRALRHADLCAVAAAGATGLLCSLLAAGAPAAPGAGAAAPCFVQLLVAHAADADAARVLRAVPAAQLRSVLSAPAPCSRRAVACLFDPVRPECLAVVCERDAALVRAVCSNQAAVFGPSVVCSRSIAAAVRDARTLERLFGLGLVPEVFVAASLVGVAYLRAAASAFGRDVLRQRDEERNTIAHAAAGAAPAHRCAVACAEFVRMIDPAMLCETNERSETPIDVARRTGFLQFVDECSRLAAAANEFDDVLCDDSEFVFAQQTHN
jgi:hypothetical protein